MYEIVEFRSGPTILRGRMYQHSDTPGPCVVMAHGISATITMVADAFAEVFHAAGLDVLLYDHANLGASGGEPRREINPWVQARGYRDAVSFLRARPDCGRIALWGDSLSANVATVAAGLIPGLSAVVAQIPTYGAELPGIEPSRERLDEMAEIFATGDVSGGPEHTLGPIPVVSADQLNAPSILKPVTAFRWFIEYGGRHGTDWENRATRVNPQTSVPFNACLTAPFIEAAVLIMAGRDDEILSANIEVQRAVFEKITTPKEFYEIDGGHFGLLWLPMPGTYFPRI